MSKIKMDSSKNSEEFNNILSLYKPVTKSWRNKSKNEGVSIYQLKIILLGTEPQVWRRIEVPSNMSLNNLSWGINDAMGWESYHLHLFKFDEFEFGPTEDGLDEWEDDKKVKVRDAFSENKSIKYFYDFGDGWQHDIIFEGEKAVDPKEQYPLCVDGKNNCPPEDVGGIGGFADYKEAMKDKSNPMYEEFFEWRGSYDPKEFSVEWTNFRMIRKKVAKNLKLKKFE